MTTLTATSKIRLHHLHADYMAAECEPGFMKFDAQKSNALYQKFVEYYTLLGLTMRQAEISTWETSQNYYAVLSEAISEGYHNAAMTPATIAWVQQQAGRA